MQPLNSASQQLRNCQLVRVPSRDGIPAAQQPDEVNHDHPWDGVVMDADPYAGDFKVVTAKLDPELTATIQEKVTRDAMSAVSEGGAWGDFLMHCAEADDHDLSRANGVAYEVPNGPPRQRPGLLGKAQDMLLGPEGREPQMWLLVDGQPIIDHDLKKQNFPPRTFS